jgi:hypothetical protein
MNVLNNDIETVSTLMEHVFSQTPTLCLQVIAIIEDTAAQLCKIVKSSAESVRLMKHNGTFKKNDKGDDKHYSTYLVQPKVFSTHSEIYGMPLITVKDIDLLIILSRTLSAGQRVEGEPQVCEYVFICTDVCIYMYIYTYTNRTMSLCVYTHTLFIYAYIYVHIYVFAYLIYICTYVYLYVHILTNIYMLIYICVYGDVYRYRDFFLLLLLFLYFL